MAFFSVGMTLADLDLGPSEIEALMTTIVKVVSGDAALMPIMDSRFISVSAGFSFSAW